MKRILFVALGCIIFLGAQQAEATNLPFHTEWQNKGDAEYGACIENEGAGTCGIVEGTQFGDQKQECKLVAGSGGFPCTLGQKRTIAAEPISCEIEKPVCEVPEEPVVETPKKEKEKRSRGDLDYSQGPDGVLGDHCVQFEWKEINGVKDVIIKVTNTGAFGTNETKYETEDDGAKTICFPGFDTVWAKFRADEDDARYSEVEKVSL